ncbi:TPA: glycosyltransferase, partial [Escherichia coli]
MREARGGIVAFLDADDYWATDHLEESVNALLLNGVEFVFSNVIEVDCCGCESRRKVTNPQYLDNKYDIILLSPPQTNSFLFRKEIFDSKEIFFDENLRRHQDYQFLT